MPYLPQKRQLELKESPLQATTEGDLNYVFTLKYLEEFTKEPRYHTIARLKTPLQFPSIQTLYSHYVRKGSGFTMSTVHAALEIAYLEFYRRIGSLYEDYAIEKNGDVDEYVQAEALIYKLSTNVLPTVTERKA